jgi:hypothetical protein
MDKAVPVVYRSVDDLNDLVIRVVIQRSAESRATDDKSAAPASSAVVGSEMLDDEHREHVVEFGWQQKVFGPRYDHASSSGCAALVLLRKKFIYTKMQGAITIVRSTGQPCQHFYTFAERVRECFVRASETRDAIPV